MSSRPNPSDVIRISTIEMLNNGMYERYQQSLLASAANLERWIDTTPSEHFSDYRETRRETLSRVVGQRVASEACGSAVFYADRTGNDFFSIGVYQHDRHNRPVPDSDYTYIGYKQIPRIHYAADPEAQADSVVGLFVLSDLYFAISRARAQLTSGMVHETINNPHFGSLSPNRNYQQLTELLAGQPDQIQEAEARCINERRQSQPQPSPRRHFGRRR